ncbi:MAG TPA: phosphate ABC transporter ATP-binding protein [Firmicutes bacterium]|nr:phosphate ABC transporter ATP-binding protein [Bacillota bacterium]
MTDVKKIYDKEVLRVDSLRLFRGSIYGVIGPSGAGKSTLLRIINMLTLPDGGRICYHGKPAPLNRSERLVLQRKMALVFQNNLLFKDTVWNNIAYGLKARRYPKLLIEERVNALLEQVGMMDLAIRRADTLSGGEAQRVAIARAIAFEPELLLLDEPTANLDPYNIELIEEMIAGLARSKDITVVIVTHNVFQARRIADHVIFVNQGKIVEMGTTEKIFTEPDQESTRLFVEGRMVY